MNLVLVAAPDLIVDDRHAADGVMRPAEVHEVIVGQVPQAVWGQKHSEAMPPQQTKASGGSHTNMKQQSRRKHLLIGGIWRASRQRGRPAHDLSRA